MNKNYIFILILIFILRQIAVLSANNDTYINTSNIIYDKDRNIIELAENSKININNTNILVDRGIIDYDNEKVEVFGNFYLYQDLNILSGRDLVGNTSLDNFTAFDVSYIYNNDLKIDSEKAIRSNDTVKFYNNFLTPCELDGFFNCPTWSMRIDETRYDIIKDKFNHYDSFLQIADYKVFYLPYFSHYGTKAPRQKGFLAPSIEFAIGGDSGVITPYYLPIRIDTDITFRPKIILDQNFNFLGKYSLNTLINQKNSGGNINIDIYNEKFGNDSNIYSSLKIESKQILTKSHVLSYKALITNSVSTTRSFNTIPSTFEDIYIRLDSYNVLYDDDYLKTEISTVEALDNTDSGLIPLTPSIKYTNQKLTKNKLTFKNDIYLSSLKRNESSLSKPSESSNFKLNNSILSNYKLDNLNVYNKFKLTNNLGSYNFKHDPNLNDDAIASNIILSSEGYYDFSKNIKPRIKFIQNINLLSENIINEDSKALTFNYINQFSDSRFYGSDLEDNSPRIVYGLENNIKLIDSDIEFNINQSYDLNKNTNYTNQINQSSNFSDYAIEAKTKLNNALLKVDARLDNRELEKKEVNYLLQYSNLFDFEINYNETNSKSFKGLSTDTKSLNATIEKKINENLILSSSSNFDLKNNYSPLTQTLKVSLLDECSRLEISYVDERFNDNYNTSPSKLIKISFYMDYLGFFGYEQKSNVFFRETGEFDYGR